MILTLSAFICIFIIVLPNLFINACDKSANKKQKNIFNLFFNFFVIMSFSSVVALYEIYELPIIEKNSLLIVKLNKEFEANFKKEVSDAIEQKYNQRCEYIAKNNDIKVIFEMCKYELEHFKKYKTGGRFHSIIDFDKTITVLVKDGFIYRYEGLEKINHKFINHFSLNSFNTDGYSYIDLIKGMNPYGNSESFRINFIPVPDNELPAGRFFQVQTDKNGGN